MNTRAVEARPLMQQRFARPDLLVLMTGTMALQTLTLITYDATIDTLTGLPLVYSTPEVWSLVFFSRCPISFCWRCISSHNHA
jgi:hypothetical protein